LVDLAGTEKLSENEMKGLLFEESKNINKSLTYLSIVIKALTQRSSTAHIPYRDSKLTRVMKECLGGTAKTLLVLTCSPSFTCLKETISTLQFGSRAKKIKSKPLPVQHIPYAQLKKMV